MQGKQLKMQKEYLNSVKIKYPPSGKELIEILKRNSPALKKEVPNIKKILLFGSYARAKPHYGSDVDLLIIVTERTKNDFEKIYEALFNISSKYEWSPLILSEIRLSELENTNKFFFKAIYKDGINIWTE
jgi:predicted nucleotidyltransferase